MISLQSQLEVAAPFSYVHVIIPSNCHLALLNYASIFSSTDIQFYRLFF